MTYLKKYLQRLIGRADIEGALENLRRLTSEEFMIAVTQIWKVVHHIQSGVDIATKKIDKLDKKIDRRFDEGRTGTFSISETLDELVRTFDEGRAGTFSTSATQKCHSKPTLHTTS